MGLAAGLTCALSASAADWGFYEAKNHPDCEGISTVSKISADLNGNKKTDRAELQQNSANKRVRVAVWLDGSKEPVFLKESTLAEAGQLLSLRKPGEKMYQGNMEKTLQKFPALVYSGCAAFDAYFIWNTKTKNFDLTLDEN